MYKLRTYKWGSASLRLLTSLHSTLIVVVFVFVVVVVVVCRRRRRRRRIYHLYAGYLQLYT